MHLVFLHGAPATGKYTVGRELAALTGFELYHNHLAVDAVLEHHAFGTPEFVAERDRLWRTHLAAAPGRGLRGLIFTFNPENSVPQAFVEWLFRELGGDPAVQLHSVELRATDAEILTRLGSAPRRGFRKLTDPVLYARLRDAGAFRHPAIPRTDLSIDTERHDAIAAARTIAAHFHLGSA